MAYNGIIVIDKPEGITSHGVVARLRRATGERRIGHGGTLDPMATGVLPVFLGRATRAAAFVQEGHKRYAARFRLGITTDTQDITGTVLEKREVLCGAEEIAAVLPEFTGEIAQIPPMYSAVSVGGRRLYSLARAGVTVEREARRVRVYELTLGTREEPDEFSLTVACSKGLYIRTLISDIGQRLGCGACMSALRRLSAGIFDIADSLTLEEAESLVASGALMERLRGADILFRELPALTLGDSETRAVKNGAAAPVNEPHGEYRLYGADGEFIGVGAARAGRLRIVKGFFNV